MSKKNGDSRRGFSKSVAEAGTIAAVGLSANPAADRIRRTTREESFVSHNLKFENPAGSSQIVTAGAPDTGSGAVTDAQFESEIISLAPE